MSDHALLDRLTADSPSARDVGVDPIARDRQLVKSAYLRLETNALLPHGAFRVTAACAWITIMGNVDHFYQRLAAVYSVRALSGLQGVYDLITVSSGLGETTSPSVEGGCTIENVGVRLLADSQGRQLSTFVGQTHAGQDYGADDRARGYAVVSCGPRHGRR